MSPKGGIRPHSRFSIESRRSRGSVRGLYIGASERRSGAPASSCRRGIIFQSQNAHRQLRKKLVEGFLVAVVFPAGGRVQPVLRRQDLDIDTRPRACEAHRQHRVLQGRERRLRPSAPQRRPIDRNDLPRARIELTEYLRRLRDGEGMDGFQPTLGLVVGKDRIAADGEYNLGGERYRVAVARNTTFPYVSLKDIATIRAGNSAPQGSEYFEGGLFPFVRTSDVGKVHRSDNFTGSADRVNQKAVDEFRLRLFPTGTILFPKSGASDISQPSSHVRAARLCVESPRRHHARRDKGYPAICLPPAMQCGRAGDHARSGISIVAP